jgi:5-methylcytosine-specific restriction endonuclease McrA
MDSANNFTITGSFDAKNICIKLDKSIIGHGGFEARNDFFLEIGFKPGQADKIGLIKDKERVTATGKIVFPSWKKDHYPEYILDVTQIAITPFTPPRLLHGYFEAKLVGWAFDDEIFALCETLDGNRIECLVPPVHARLAQMDSKYLIGSYFRLDCTLEWGECIRAFRIKPAEIPTQKIYLLPPNKASQAWDNFQAQGWPQTRNRKVSPKLRREVFMRDGYKCRECGSSPDKNHAFLEVDHIIPFSRGGSCSIDNLQTLCSECNAGKSDGMPHPAALASLRLPNPWI